MADEYYRQLTTYGVEFASLWLDDQLQTPEDIRLFKSMQHDAAVKFGLVA